jgi:hypothetical protein
MHEFDELKTLFCQKLHTWKLDPESGDQMREGASEAISTEGTGGLWIFEATGAWGAQMPEIQCC